MAYGKPTGKPKTPSIYPYPMGTEMISKKQGGKKVVSKGKSKTK